MTSRIKSAFIKIFHRIYCVLKVMLIISFIAYTNSNLTRGESESVLDSPSLTGYWSEPSTIAVSPVSDRSTHSRGVYTYGPAGQIIIEKYIKGLADIYDKGDNITIRLKIINCDRRNYMEDVYIRDEIPEEFELVDAKPNNYKEISSISTDEKVTPRMIEWYCKDKIDSIRVFEYTVRSNKSGRYVFCSTLLKTKVKDSNGRTYEILQTSDNDIFITIRNRDPNFAGISPQSPAAYKMGEKIPIDIFITDPNYEPIICELSWGDYKLKNYNNSYEFHDRLRENCTSFNFCLDNAIYELGENIYAIKASDGESQINEELKINIYKRYKWFPTAKMLNPETIIDNLFEILQTIIAAVIGILIGRHSKASKNPSAEVKK